MSEHRSGAEGAAHEGRAEHRSGAEGAAHEHRAEHGSGAEGAAHEGRAEHRSGAEGAAHEGRAEHTAEHRGRADLARLRRDRRGRGLRGPLVPPGVPLHRSRAQQFDDLVLDAVDHLEHRWASQLEGVEFAVEDVPPMPLRVPGDGLAAYADSDPDAVSDDAGVPLGRLQPAGRDASGRPTPARVVVYRRPLEARSADRGDLADLVLDVVVEQLARLLGIDPDELDPPD